MHYKYLILGKGGREYSIADKLSTDSRVDKIYIYPGHIGFISIPKVNIYETENFSLEEFLLNHKIDILLVGEEKYLFNGTIDIAEKLNILSFGVNKNLALLESSKLYAKELLLKLGINTAQYKSIESSQDLDLYLIKNKSKKVVLKYSGSCSGKGVIVTESRDELIEHCDKYSYKDLFVEDYIDGEEFSLFYLIDKNTIIPLAAIKDYKRRYDNNLGLNTGGMGAYADTNNEYHKYILHSSLNKIIEPVINHLRNNGEIYRGVLFAGVTVKDNIIYLLEFNVRFGDPECEVLMNILNYPFHDLIFNTITDNLHILTDVSVKLTGGTALGVVLVEKNYPSNVLSELQPLSKDVINLLTRDDIKIYFNNLTLSKNILCTSNGRSITIVTYSQNSDLITLREKIYTLLEKIHIPNLSYRSDIGLNN